MLREHDAVAGETPRKRGGEPVWLIDAQHPRHEMPIHVLWTLSSESTDAIGSSPSDEAT